MKKTTILAILAIGFIFTSCTKDEEITEKRITQSFQNLPDLGDNYIYEGWLIVGNQKISTGRFSHTEGTSFTSNAIDISAVNSATTYVLTIEPATETGADLASPSGWIFSKGNFANNTATPSTKDALFSGDGNLETATGKFFLKAPSVDKTGSDANGIWFIDALPPTKGGFTSLPTLASGWIYEGWVVVPNSNGGVTPVSTGRFSDPNKADVSFFGAANNNEFKGPNGVPPFPGEDFIADPNNRYSGVTFPINLQNATVVISIEPTTNDTAAPFGLKPLAVKLSNQATATAVSLTNNYANKKITGTVKR
ncbi:MAG: anti-sigma factor [Flavobacteriaceae bacterium]|nr:anti-sigma factor [Flavobacteriaceae bacterium]